MGAWTRRLTERIGPPPEEAPVDALARIARRASASHRMRAARAMGARGDVAAAPLLGSLLEDVAPGVRRSAAWALGALGDRRAVEALLARAVAERCDEPRLAMAVAAARCGAPVAEAWAILERAGRRSMATFFGRRDVAVATGAGPGEMAGRFARALRPGTPCDAPGALVPEPLVSARNRVLHAISGNPDDRDLLADLGAMQHHEDVEPILERRRTAGRREHHALCCALGLNGDPRAVPFVMDVLHAVDVDPGHGFRGRATAAEALGRIGDPDTAPSLVRALDDEAMDHEGRPGAGLGIQLPVRAHILVALGEVGALRAAPVLAGYLANTSGSATGGFYLPAMDALWKLGDPVPVEALLGGSEIETANALGVLGALGRADRVRAFLRDVRPAVAAAAQDALRELDVA